MTDETKPETVQQPRIVIHADGELSNVDVAVLLADAAAERLADALQVWADECVEANQIVTAADVDKVANDMVTRFSVTLGRSLSRRNSPGIAVLRAVTNTRNQTLAAARAAPVMVPEYQEVETRAVYDERGKLAGTRTTKQLVRSRT